MMISMSIAVNLLLEQVIEYESKIVRKSAVWESQAVWMDMDLARWLQNDNSECYSYENIFKMEKTV